jgi:hypothetical protein
MVARRIETSVELIFLLRQTALYATRLQIKAQLLHFGKFNCFLTVYSDLGGRQQRFLFLDARRPETGIGISSRHAP